jgi:ribonuclease HI
LTKFDAQIWTDGSQDKEGYGGCAAIITVPSGKQLVLTSGALAPTTNQRMELLAPIIALNRLWWRSDPFHAAKTRSDKRVVIISDSAYLTNCFKQNWIVTWRRNDWITSKGAEVKNRVLWETLENLVVQYQEVKFVHVHGHNGDAMNET